MKKKPPPPEPDLSRKIREAGIKIGAALSSRMGAFIMDASSACAGLDQKELYRQLSVRGNIMLKAFSEDMGKI